MFKIIWQIIWQKVKSLFSSNNFNFSFILGDHNTANSNNNNNNKEQG